MDSTATHIAPLITAIMNTEGPILEMGCGDYSTPLLHAICQKQKRDLLSCDTSAEWIKKFIDLESNFHKFKYIQVYEDDLEKNPKPWMWNIITNRYGVVFVDHRPGERRREDIYRLRDLADVLVVHDTEQPSYGYENVLPMFKYRYDYKRYPTWTTLVSNRIDVTKFWE